LVETDNCDSLRILGEIPSITFNFSF